MKLILENWKKFLDESKDPRYTDKIDMDDEGNVILYHLSPSSEMTELDPAIAAKKRKNYSTQEFTTWDRPRVFFFTRKGQTDPGIGDIPGQPYFAKFPLSKLYPVHKDPAGFSSKKSKQEWFLDSNPTPPGGGDSFREYFKKSQKCDGSHNEYHPCSKYEKEFGVSADGLAYFEDRFMGRKLLVDHPKFSAFGNTYEQVASLAAKQGYKGFIYPHADNPNDIIVPIWENVPIQKMDEPFYE